MKKFFVILTSLLLVFTLQATSKGRPVRLGSLSGYIGKPKSNRAPAKELVSLYQRGCRPPCQCGGRSARHSNSQRRG